MAQQNVIQMRGGKGDNYQFTDATYYTKIFVGGLAWETRREDMKHYFEKFGAIEEAVVITDKITGRSKGYGFVTFKDPNAAMRACQDPFPVIDGRRTNCNLACLGAHRTRPSTPQYGNNKWSFRAPTPPTPVSMATPSHQGSSMAYFQQLACYAFPYSTYGCSAGCSSEDNMFPMIYPCANGGQQYSNFHNMAVTSSMPRTYPNSYALYAQYAQIGQVQGFDMKYPSMVQYSNYIPQQYYSTSMFLSSAPSSATSTVTNTGVNMGGTASVVARTSTPAPGTISNQNSSA